MEEGLILIYGAAAGAPLLLVGVLIWSGLERRPAARAKERTIVRRRYAWAAAARAMTPRRIARAGNRTAA